MRKFFLGLAAGLALVGRGADGMPAAGAGQAAPRAEPGPLACRVVFPTDQGGRAEPLLSVGTGGAGDIVFVYYYAAGRISFGWEQPGQGVVFSDPVDITPGQPHRLVIALGSLLPSSAPPGSLSAPAYRALRDTVLVQLDGRTMLAAHGTFQPFAPGRVFVGRNVVGGAVAGAFFTGRITEVSPADSGAVLAGVSVLANFLQPGAGQAAAGAPGEKGKAGYPGPVLIRLRFPRGLAGQSEPLVVTGKTGAGDIVYVHYDNDHQLRIGFDHWSVGGPVSDPVEIDPDRTQELLVSLGSMQPPAAGGHDDPYAALRHQCLVFVNGRQVLRCFSKFYPASPAQILVAINPIGGSTAGPKFSGIIIHAEPMRPEDIPTVTP